MYNDEEKSIKHTYYNISRVGMNLLIICKNLGITSNDRGKKILNEVDTYLGGTAINNKELANNTQKWYEGVFCPGYYMNDNDSEFAYYLKKLMNSHEVF